jgi:hypothetical protein
MPPEPPVQPPQPEARLRSKPSVLRFFSFLKDGRWWIDHSVDLMTLIATIILTFLIHHLDAKDRERDTVVQNAATKQLTASQDLARAQNAAEGDAHQAFSLLAGLEEHETNGHEVERRGIAATIEQFASDGRLYEPTDHIFIPSVGSECYEATFDHLKKALLSVANVQSHSALTDEDKKRDEGERKKTQAKLQAAISARAASCATQQPVGEGAALQDRSLDLPLGSFNVGCEESKTDSVTVALSSIVPKGYMVHPPVSVDFRDTSNIKSASQSASIQGEDIVVNYSLVGLDAQAFPFGIKNCPGGGHGTLILHVMLTPSKQ